MAKVVMLRELGGPEVLRIEEADVGAPKQGEVRIRVEAIGLNRAEAMFRAGRYPVTPELPTRMGYECSGVIEAVGPSVTAWQPGDAVCVMPNFRLGTYGVWGEEAIVPVSSLLKPPPALSTAECAAIWMPYFTALAIIEGAGATIDDYVVIRAASSSVGLAAIQLANWTGAVSIAATRTGAKRDALLEHGAQHVVATDEQLAESMCERGILFVYGGLSEQPTPYPHWQSAFRGLSIRGWIASEIWSHPQRFERYKQVIYQGLERGKLKPAIARTFPLDEIVEANRYLESNQQVGKVVVTV
jgi:NADPH:quinone reductase-like Zn-dependent oxidoreductase